MVWIANSFILFADYFLIDLHNVFFITHPLKSVSVRKALNIRLAVSSRTDCGSRRMFEIHTANAE